MFSMWDRSAVFQRPRWGVPEKTGCQIFRLAGRWRWRKSRNLKCTVFKCVWRNVWQARDALEIAVECFEFSLLFCLVCVPSCVVPLLSGEIFGTMVEIRCHILKKKESKETSPHKMPVSLRFEAVSTDFNCAISALAQNESAKTILIVGEKASLVSENALPLDALRLPSDFLEPIANDTTESITAYIEGKTIIAATFSDKKSRNVGPIRGDALHQLVQEKAGGKNDVIILARLKNNEQVLTASLAIARAFPKFERKKEQSPVRTVTVHFVLAESPKAVTTTTTTKNVVSTPTSKTITTKTTTTKKVASKTSIDAERIQIVADAVREAANLVDTPPNELNPTTYVEIVRAIHKEKLEAAGVTLTVIQGTELRERGFGGIWNVGKASENLPALVILSHTPENARKTVAWVGKGLTFDAGGLNIKVGGGMTGMKTDMGGSAGILHGFVATVLNKVNTNFALHAILCIAENSVDARSFRPDDIITAYSGKTVEVVDTDAEGRLCLMDGVAYASKDLNADVVVDMATLTGSQAYATGLRHAGFITNSSEFEKEVVEAGKASGDLAFPMLYCPEYQGVDKIMPSVVADSKNWLSSMDVPSASAGLFVGSHLVPDEKWVEEGEGLWAHIDMALPSKALGRANGYGVGILFSLAETLNTKFAEEAREE
ncbi:cytosol aminopeptidase family, catalytic domain-containing protein [Obelidium mucronatum]|nr:cytosol aminopeptidase family, catalytic domain-containing protein [Obelidium mucronatum]